MVKLADTLDLGSSAIACRFKSCHPYQKIRRHFAVFHFFCPLTDLRQFTIVGKQCLQPVLVQLTASKERRKRVAFAEIVRSGHSKQTRHAVTRAMHGGATAPFV